MLNKYRKEMDIINKNISLLLIKRFQLLTKIAEFKKKNNQSFFDKKRTQQIHQKTKKITARSKAQRNIQKIFKTILSESLKYLNNQ